MLSFVLISCNENPPNKILNQVFKLNSVENKLKLESESQAVNKAQRLLGLEPNFSELFKSRALIKDINKGWLVSNKTK